MDERAAAQHSLVVGYKVKVQRMATSRVAEVCCISNAAEYKCSRHRLWSPAPPKTCPVFRLKRPSAKVHQGRIGRDREQKRSGSQCTYDAPKIVTLHAFPGFVTSICSGYSRNAGGPMRYKNYTVSAGRRPLTLRLRLFIQVWPPSGNLGHLQTLTLSHWSVG